MLRLASVLVILALAAAGCTRSRLPDLHPVKGTVLKDGTPLETALVKLRPQTPEEVDLTISGVTNAQGHFALDTIEIRTSTKRTGVPPGTYTVVVTLPMSADQSGGGEFEVPGNYTVQAGDNTIPTIDVAKKK